MVPQTDTLDTELTVRENLAIYGRYFGLSRAEVASRATELLEFAQLTERADDQVEPLSGGMKRRLTIARSLINEPTVLLLDEPTTGLDPQARHLLWDRLYRLKQRGVTLVLTTHYMDEAEQLCDRLVVMDKARIVAEGSPRALIEQYSTREVAELRFAPGIAETLDGQLEGIAATRGAPPRPRPVVRGRRRSGGLRGPRTGPEAGDRAGPPVLARGRLPAPDRALADRVARVTSLAHPSSAIGRVFEHRYLQYKRTFRASVFSSFLSPALFLTAMGLGLGAYVSDPAALDGVPYLVFLAPGLLAATAMQSASFESTFPIMGGLVWSRIFHSMYATPITPRDIALGNLAWIAARLLLISTIFTIVIVLFGAAESPLIVLAIPAAVLTGMAFAGPIAAFSATQKTPNRFAAIFRFGITPLFLFSGTFFPISSLPDALQAFAWLTPLFHGVALTRGLSLGIIAEEPVAALIHVTYLSTLALVGAWLTIRNIRRTLVKG